MNLMAGFLGFSIFTAICLAIGLLGYWQADSLERWAKTHVGKLKQQFPREKNE